MNEIYAIEKAARRRAAVLAQGMHPAYNAAPLLELVVKAYSLGYELRRMSDAEIQAMRLGVNSAGGSDEQA